MKTKLLFSFFLLSSAFAYAQTQALWGMSFLSSGPGGGYISRINNDGSGYANVYQFVYATGQNPYGNLIQASDGDLYGTTYEGGPSGSCVIFRFNVQTNTYTDVHDFYFNDGYIPFSGVVETNGKLYGVTWDGGTTGAGVLYSYDLASGIYTDEYNFDGPIAGGSPYAAPILASDGKLYGVTESGGANNFGVVY